MTTKTATWDQLKRLSSATGIAHGLKWQAKEPAMKKQIKAIQLAKAL